MSQCSRLLTYLEQHGDITRGEAFMELGIANLWARVLELEARGWTFDRKSVQVPVRGGGYTTVTRYTLIASPESAAQARYPALSGETGGVPAPPVAADHFQPGQGVLPARAGLPSSAAPTSHAVDCGVS